MRLHALWNQLTSVIPAPFGSNPRNPGADDDDDDDKEDDCKDLKERKECVKSKGVCSWCDNKYGPSLCFDEVRRCHCMDLITGYITLDIYLCLVCGSRLRNGRRRGREACRDKQQHVRLVPTAVTTDPVLF